MNGGLRAAVFVLRGLAGHSHVAGHSNSNVRPGRPSFLGRDPFESKDLLSRGQRGRTLECPATAPALPRVRNADFSAECPATGNVRLLPLPCRKSWSPSP